MAIIPPPGAGSGLLAQPSALLDEAPGGAEGQLAAGPRSMLRRGWEVFAENKLALASIAMIVFIVLFCFAGPLIYHTNQVNTDLNDTLCRPSSAHPLGCDNLGYDQLGRLKVLRAR